MNRNHLRRVIVSLLIGLPISAPISSGGALGAERFERSAQGNPTIQQRLDRVREGLFSGAGRPEQSIQELKAILAADPGSAEAHLLLGIAYRAAGSSELM